MFDEATFTDNGKKAAALLLEYLQLKHFPRVTLTGHADERGTDELNMNLSKERLDTVAKYLKDGGYKGELEPHPQGQDPSPTPAWCAASTRRRISISSTAASSSIIAR